MSDNLPQDEPLDSHPELIAEPPLPLPVDRSKLSQRARLEQLENRVDEIIATQVRNIPIFRAVLSRILGMRETLHAHSNSLMRLEALITKSVSAQEATSIGVAANAVKLDNLLAFTVHARTWAGYARKYWPRFATFGLGIAVARGWITAENGTNILHLFRL